MKYLSYKTYWRTPQKKLILIVLFLIVFLITMAWDTTMFEWIRESNEELQCFALSGNKLFQLNEKEPIPGASIFFHETSCSKDMSDISLNARQACSIESALRAHTDTDVFLLISSPVFKTLKEIENKLVRQLLSYGNFKLRHINFSHYLSNTPLKVIYTSGALNYSHWPVPHSSDVLRYATLYKFGGIYLDLDVIVLKPLSGLNNFVGIETNISLGSGILGFAYDRPGREVAEECVKELASTFNGQLWSFNGPGVITRVLRQRCSKNMNEKLIESTCDGFHIYSDQYFTAMPYYMAHIFFQEGNTETAEKLFNKSYTIHFWNKLSSKFVISRKSKVPFLKYAEKYCPKIFGAADGNF